jgi:hypothetical protein
VVGKLHTYYYDPLNRSQSSQVPNVIPTLNPDPPSSKNTGLGQPIQTDKTDNLLGPRSSQLQRTLDSVLTQKPPDTVFSGPKSVPRGDVPLSNPVIVRAPNEEGAHQQKIHVSLYPMKSATFHILYPKMKYVETE